MDEDDDSAALQHQAELEQRERFEYEQRMLRADPAFEQWLEKLERTEVNHVNHC